MEVVYEGTTRYGRQDTLNDSLLVCEIRDSIGLR